MKFYITTAIDYLNAPPHMGHALEKVEADALARYHRLRGDEVYFLTGTDEHGMKIVRTSESAGKKPKEFADEIVIHFQKLIEILNISNDDFIRTSDKQRHFPGAQALWKKLEEAGDIYKGTYEGYYCIGCEAFMAKRELVEGRCPIHNKEPEMIEEENYFFRLSKYIADVKKRIEAGEFEILPETRKKEVISILEAGMEDISFSRPKEKLEGWGVPVPGDESHIMYVWSDALTNYITALGYGSKDDSLFKKFWPADVHVIGKDIVRFHAIYWPAMLLSANVPLPKTIFAHGFILSGGRKMSKSLGNVVDPLDLARRYGGEALRYYLLREVTHFEDGDITEEKFKEAYNANLANGLGNLVSRIMKMYVSYEVEAVPRLHKASPAFGRPRKDLPDEYTKALENFEINKAADFVWKKIGEMDSFIQNREPFKKIKTEPEEAKRDVGRLVIDLWSVARLLEPFLPETADKIQELIEQKKTPEKPLFPRKD